MIITLPFIYCSWRESNLKTVLLHRTEPQSIPHWNHREDDQVQSPSRQCASWGLDIFRNKGKHSSNDDGWHHVISDILLLRSDSSTSPRHQGSNNRSSETISSIVLQTQVPSMILRDTSIREQLPSSIKESSSFNINSNYNSSTFLSRERDCSSPYLSSSNCGSSNMASLTFNNQSRENNVALLRENHLVHNTPRVASNRLLSGGLDQRIIKQSTEDCRRLLQQVRVVILIAVSNTLIQSLIVIVNIKFVPGNCSGRH